MDAQCNKASSVPVRFDWLCTRCSSIFDSNAVLYPHEKSGFQTRQYHHNVEQLKASVSLGCQLCTALLSSMKEELIRGLENALASASSDRKVNADHRMIAVFPEPFSGTSDDEAFCKSYITHLCFYPDLDIPLSLFDQNSLSPKPRLSRFTLFPADCKISGNLMREEKILTGNNSYAGTSTNTIAGDKYMVGAVPGTS